MIDLQERPSITVEMPTAEADLPVDVMTFANHFDDPSVRSKIDHLERKMVEMGGKPIEARHYFANGIYAREIFIPKGTLLTGKIHKTEHLNIVSQGEISVLTEAGPQRVKAPFTIVSLPGTKRVGYAHEDTVWTTIHATTETDLDKLEAELIAESHEAYLQHVSVLELEGK